MDIALFLYNLFNSPWTWIFLVFWGLIGIASFGRLKLLVLRLVALTIKPIIFISDPKPGEPPLYPRTILEAIVHGLLGIFSPSPKDIAQPLSEFVRNQNGFVFNKAYPLRTFMYPILLLCALAFFYADAISIAHAVALIMPTGTFEIPDILIGYQYAVGIATFLSSIIGFFILGQVFTPEPPLVNPVTNDSFRAITKVLTLVIILIGVLVGILLGIGKLIGLGIIPTNDIINFLVQLGAHVLILTNGTLSASIIAGESAYGLITLLIVVQWLLIGIVIVIYVILKILIYVVSLIVDIASRVIYAIVDLLIYFIVSPIITLVSIPIWLVAKILGR